MRDLQKLYREKAEAFGALLGRDDTDPAASTPCEGWTVADVVDHVVDTQRDFLARHTDLGPRPDGDLATRWAAHSAAVEALPGDLWPREYDGYFGRTTVGATLVDFYGFDMVVHRWDVARALGRDELFTDAELDLLETSIAGFGDAMYSEGICKPAVPVPGGASRQDRLLALTGRDPR
ncbi:TIGR03086 family metal-binding protein [Pseudonocardia sp.]|uniref:TIGR03086 family metal-binding protein n=1 Tax=Pseudonocardia sp. TaxID=60912 RepID=UPI003D0F91D8